MKGANRKLGELLIREEVISRQQLEEALREQQSSKQFLGEILIQLGYISEEELIGFLVRQCRIPHLKLSNLTVASDVSRLLPEEICRDHKLLPIDKLGTLLTVAMVNPLDVEALEKVKQQVKLRIKPILCSFAEFKQLYVRIYGPEDRRVEQVETEPAEDLSADVSEKPPGNMPEKVESQAAKGTQAPSKSKKNTKQIREDEDAEERDEAKGEVASATRTDGLIERFTFKDFVVAEVNSFTYALAASIAELPGSEYNPFFLYGNTGLGKTHLSNAIGNEMVRRGGVSAVAYAPASRFVDEMLDAVEHEHLKAFRERYANMDMLIVDDIQFLSHRTRAQEEFFNIFNAIYTRKKQIIVVSDVPPKKLEGLEDRLISRFEGGVVACLEQPDLQTRLTILKQQLKAAGANVPSEVLELLAESIPSNIRELEGALKKLLAYSSLVGHDITIELAQEILKHLFKSIEK